MKEAHGGIKSRSAPHLKAEEIRKALSDSAGGGEQIVRANTRCHQRLMRIAKGRVRNQQALFFSCPSPQISSAQASAAIAAFQEAAQCRERKASTAFSEDLSGLVCPLLPDCRSESRRRDRRGAWWRDRRGCAGGNSSGDSSRKEVVTSPARKRGWLTTFSRKGMLVFTPRMRNSRSARSMRWQASGSFVPQAVTFTRSES